MKRTVSPNGATISARICRARSVAPAVPDAAVYGATATADDTTRQDIVRLLGLIDR